MAINPEEQDLILKQYAGARKKLEQQQKVGQEALNTRLARAQAVTGLQGGAQVKAAGKAQRELQEASQNAQLDLEATQAAAMQKAQEAQTARSFQTSEREAGQGFAAGEAQKGREFQSGEAAKDRLQQDTQFRDTLNFQKGSFAEQMKYQWNEFNENQKTNIINAAIALRDAKLDDPTLLAKAISAVKTSQGTAPGVVTAQPFKDEINRNPTSPPAGNTGLSSQDKLKNSQLLQAAVQKYGPLQYLPDGRVKGASRAIDEGGFEPKIRQTIDTLDPGTRFDEPQDTASASSPNAYKVAKWYARPWINKTGVIGEDAQGNPVFIDAGYQRRAGF